MSSGFYRGDLGRQVDDAIAAFNRLSPEEQLAHRNAQRESYVRGELAMGSDADEAAYRASHTAPKRDILGAEIGDPRLLGFTGNTCSYCGSTRMQISGHCEACADCGETTGCS